jgi:hypothetical protein
MISCLPNILVIVRWMKCKSTLSLRYLTFIVPFLAMPLNYELTQPGLHYEINFSIIIKHRLIVLGLIPLTSYSWSAEFFINALVSFSHFVTRHLLDFHGLLTLLNLCQIFVIRLVSPLQCNLFGPYIGDGRYMCILMVL